VIPHIDWQVGSRREPFREIFRVVGSGPVDAKRHVMREEGRIRNSSLLHAV
jgi:hypothetical protein